MAVIAVGAALWFLRDLPAAASITAAAIIALAGACLLRSPAGTVAAATGIGFLTWAHLSGNPLPVEQMVMAGLAAFAAVVVDWAMHSRRANRGMRSEATSANERGNFFRERSHLYSNILHAVPDAVVVIDRDDVIQFVSQNIIRFAGVESEAMIGERAYDVLACQEEPEQKALHQERRLQGIAETYESIIKHPERGDVLVMVKVSPFYDENGERVGAIGILSDITELRARELQEARALRKSEAKYRTLVEHIPASIVELDLQGKIHYSSRNLDTRPRQVAGLNYVDLLPESEHAEYQKAFDRAAQSYSVASFEAEFNDTDGTNRWWQHLVIPIMQDGELVKMLLIATETTAAKSAELALRDAEARMRKMVEAIPDLMFRVTPEGRVTDLHAPHDADIASRGLVRVGSTLEQLLPEELAELVYLHIAQAESTGSLQTFEYVVDIDNQQRAFEARVVAMENGEAVVMSRDITQRRNTEEALRQSEDRYRGFFKDDLSATYIASIDGTLLDCNPAFAKMFGYRTPAEALATPIEKFYPEKNNRDEFLALLKRKRKLEHYESELIGRHGKPIHVLSNIVGVFDDNDELVQIRGYMADNSERKHLEEQLRHAQKMEAVGRLAGGIAHDFNNTLTSIIGYNELLMSRLNPSDPLYKYAREVMLASDRAAALTKRLLAFSRKQVAEPRAIDLNALVLNIEKMLKRTIGEQVELSVIVDASVGRIEADPGIIEQALINLAVNARDAMPRGGSLRIATERVTGDRRSLRRRVGLDDGDYVVLSIADTGVGMDAETQSHIFEPFFTTKAPGKGTGLGLATVYGGIQSCGGRIEVKSAPDRGTTFRIYLPVTSAQSPAPRAEKQQVLDAGSETILVAEDEPAVRSLIIDVLESKGYRVLAANDGQSALRHFRDNRDHIRLLISDIVMPTMNGRELAQAILNEKPETKVLFISGYIGDATVRISELADGTSFLSKPFTSGSLIRKIRFLLDGESHAIRAIKPGASSGPVITPVPVDPVDPVPDETSSAT